MNLSAFSFFQPAILSALGFLGVVVFLHFFKRKTVKKMEVSTLRFLPSEAVNRSRVKKIADWLLLLARLLLVAIIVLLFAGLHDSDDPLAPLRDPYGVVFVWIDQTMSMEYFEDGETKISRAINLADTLAKILPPAARLTIYNETHGIATRHGAPDIAAAVDAFLYDSKDAHSAVFIVMSDFQKSTAEVLDSVLQNFYDDIENDDVRNYDVKNDDVGNHDVVNDDVENHDNRNDNRSDNNKTVINIKLTPREPFNYAVRVREGATTQDGVAATIYAHGAPLAESLVELYVGELRVGQSRVEIPANDSAVITFDLPNSLSVSDGGGGGVIVLNAADPLPFDNRAYFTLGEESRRTALIVGNMQNNRVIEAAMRAASQNYWHSITRKDVSELLYDDLNNADLIIVNNFTGRSRMLESFINSAGADKGIVIALDPDREDDFGRTFLRTSALSQRTQNIRVSQNGARPILSDTSVAPWRGFPALSSRNARIYRYISPLPGDMFARLDGQNALAAYLTHGGANVIFLSTPIGTTQANNLSETGFFVPFVDRVARYALSVRGGADDVWFAGEVVRNPFFGSAHGGAIYDSDGRLAVTLANQPFVRIAEPGIYAIASSLGETSHRSANAHPRESEMKFIYPREQNGRGIYYFEYDEFLEQLSRGYGDLWARRLWIILCAIICAEVLLWKRR